MTVRRIYDRLANEDAFQFGVKVPAARETVHRKAPVRVACDNAASWYWTSTQNDWTLGDDSGPLRLPFDEMWFEWEFPSRIYAEHQWLESGAAHAQACHLRRSEHLARCATGVEAHDYLSASFFTAAPGKPIALMPMGGMLAVDEKGALVKWSVVYDERALLGTPTEKINDAAHDLVMPALIALGMMNCKNVTVRELAPRPVTNKAQRRRGDMRFSYHVIELPSGGRSDRTRASARADAGEPNAMHLVRGHFKTYTSEAPLFGQRTGTYWWGWHERGSAEQGFSLHDYSVGPIP